MTPQEASLMKEAAAAIIVLSRQRDAALTKIAAYEQSARVEKLASAMIGKGLRDADEYSALVDELNKTAAENREELEVLERATSLVGPDMGRKLASIENRNEGNNVPGRAAQEFVAAILG